MFINPLTILFQVSLSVLLCLAIRNVFIYCNLNFENFYSNFGREVLMLKFLPYIESLRSTSYIQYPIVKKKNTDWTSKSCVFTASYRWNQIVETVMN